MNGDIDMETKKKCIICGKSYTESNGYGVCLFCENGIDIKERDIYRRKKKEGVATK